MIDWRKHLSALSSEIEFHPPAEPEKIAKAEKQFGFIFPDALKKLWGQSNGLADEYGTLFVWPCDEIFEQNMAMRTNPDFGELYMPFDSLLFFGDDGGGDMFFLRILDGEIRDEFTFRWDHESDSRIWEADHLKAFIESYVTPHHE